MKYISIHHSTAYTAQEIAASAHIKGENLAKTVIVKIDGKMAMAVLPAKFKIDLARLKETTGSSVVELAAENIEILIMFSIPGRNFSHFLDIATTL